MASQNHDKWWTSEPGVTKGRLWMISLRPRFRPESKKHVCLITLRYAKKNKEFWPQSAQEASLQPTSLAGAPSLDSLGPWGTLACDKKLDSRRKNMIQETWFMKQHQWWNYTKHETRHGETRNWKNKGDVIRLWGQRPSDLINNRYVMLTHA